MVCLIAVLRAAVKLVGTVDHHLKGVPIFAGLSDAALGLFLDQAQHLVVPDVTLIAREGEINHCMFIIASGKVRVVKHLGEANETELATLGAKEFFGEMCILEPLPRSASVQAAGAAVVYSISSHAFLSLYEKMPAEYGILLLNIARDLSRRLRRIDELYAERPPTAQLQSKL